MRVMLFGVQLEKLEHCPFSGVAENICSPVYILRWSGRADESALADETKFRGVGYAHGEPMNSIGAEISGVQLPEMIV